LRSLNIRGRKAIHRTQKRLGTEHHGRIRGEDKSGAAELDQAEAELKKLSLFEKEILKNTSALTQMDNQLRQDFLKALRG